MRVARTDRCRLGSGISVRAEVASDAYRSDWLLLASDIGQTPPIEDKSVLNLLFIGYNGCFELACGLQCVLANRFAMLGVVAG